MVVGAGSEHTQLNGRQVMSAQAANGDIRIGTIVNNGMGAPSYIRQILSHGFESFSLFFWQHTRQIEWERLAEELSDALSGTDAVISSMGTYGNPLEAGELSEATRESLEACIEHAHLFGCDLITTITGRVKGCAVPEGLARFKEVWGPLSERAAEKGLRIAFETWDGGGTWLSGDLSIAHNPEAWSMMFEALPAENVGLELCPGTMLLKLISPVPLIREWGSRIFHLHGKDATVRWDVLQRYGLSSLVDPKVASKGGFRAPPPFVFFRTPGFGDTNWTDLISELRFAGFRGSIDIEGRNDPIFKGDLEMSGQVASLRYLQECRAREYVPNPTVG